MAREPRDKQSTIKLFPAERDAVDELIRALRKDHGTKASREDIFGAMAHGVSVHQLRGMLSEYLKHDEWGQGSLPKNSEDE
jgi:hypothetical protein